MRIIIVLLVLLLAGCGAESDRYHGRGGHYTAVTDLGIRYRFDDPAAEPLTADQIDAIYRHVGECFGLWYEPDLLLVFVDKPEDGYTGLYYDDPPMVLIHSRMSAQEQAYTLAHEFVHHYLYKSTGDLDPEHLSPMYAACFYFLT